MSLTLVLEYETSTLHCSYERVVTKDAGEAAQAFFDYLFSQKGARRIYAYTEDYNLASQHLCEKLGMRREGVFLEFISFVNDPDGTPRYENTVQYAILKKEWK